MNLRLETEDTLSLGIETHVCEVQLLLLSMATIKVQHKYTMTHCKKYLHQCTDPQKPFLQFFISVTHALRSTLPYFNMKGEACKLSCFCSSYQVSVLG